MLPHSPHSGAFLRDLAVLVITPFFRGLFNATTGLNCSNLVGLISMSLKFAPAGFAGFPRVLRSSGNNAH